MPQKVFTAKNGAKYIKLPNGRCKFVKGGKIKKKGGKKGGSLKTGGSMKSKGKSSVMY